MGSVYMIMATNMGPGSASSSRSPACSVGSLMGGIWWIYGIGYKGAAPEWKEVPGKTVIQEVDLLFEAGLLDEPFPYTAQDDSLQAAGELDARARGRGLAQGRRVGTRVRSGRGLGDGLPRGGGGVRRGRLRRHRRLRDRRRGVPEAARRFARPARVLAPPVLHAGRGRSSRSAPRRAGPCTNGTVRSTPPSSASTCT